jgi:heme oxygenase
LASGILSSDLPARLRAATDVAHRRLERGLDLLAAPTEARLTAVLARFWGFHAAWEPAMQTRLELHGLMEGRYRAPLLTNDLMAMGLTRPTIEALPVCPAAAEFAASPERALGSLYVLEGSTLGGRIIGRSLRPYTWMPHVGLRYFDPHGALCGPMWRRLQHHLRDVSGPTTNPEIEAGALAAFALLQTWLVETAPTPTSQLPVGKLGACPVGSSA